MLVKGFALTRQSVIPVVVIVVLIVTGCLLPYLSMQYLNQTIEVDRVSRHPVPRGAVHPRHPERVPAPLLQRRHRT